MAVARRQGGVRAGGGGYTLIEVMVVVAIIGIIAMIAYPSYLKYGAQANRSAAESFMFEVASRQERFMVDARQYATDINNPAAAPLNLGMSIPTSVSNNYTVTLVNVAQSPNPPAYTIQAVPVGRQATNDALCGTLTVDNTGNKTVSGPGGVTVCWKS